MSLAGLDHDHPATRCLTMLNQQGDTTITWEAEHDDEMMALIEKKIAAGVSFYIIPQRKAGQRGALPKPKKLTEPAKARAHRALVIRDEDFSKFVLEGKGTAVPTPAQDLDKTAVKRATSAREVASGRSVAVAPRRGG